MNDFTKQFLLLLVAGVAVNILTPIVVEQIQLYRQRAK